MTLDAGNPPGGRRMPLQARSAASQERLLDAAERLFSERGYDETTVAQIARAAHSSVGVFYSRFSDKAEIFRAVQVRLIQRMQGLWEAAEDLGGRQSTSLAEIIRSVVLPLAAFMHANARLIQALAIRTVADPAVRRQAVQVSHLLLERIQRLVLTRRDEITHRDPELAIEIGFRMVFATLQQTAHYGDTPPTPHPEQPEDLALELAGAYHAYLTAPNRVYPGNP